MQGWRNTTTKADARTTEQPSATTNQEVTVPPPTNSLITHYPRRAPLAHRGGTPYNSPFTRPHRRVFSFTPIAHSANEARRRAISTGVTQVKQATAAETPDHKSLVADEKVLILD